MKAILVVFFRFLGLKRANTGNTSVCYLSQVEESHRVAGVTGVDPTFLTRVVELHVADVSLACFLENKTKKTTSACIDIV